MSKKTKCAYCGSNNPKTKDHIPPKGLYPKPLPKNLITVPCCKSCHKGTSEDDLYFRSVLLTASNLVSDEKAMKQLDHAVKSLAQPKRAKLANFIVNSIVEPEIVSEAGIILGKQLALKIDHDRIERVLVRIIRGLYYNELGKPLPEGCNVFAQIDQFGKIANTLASEGYFQPAKWAADGMFGYTYAKTIEKDDATVWLGVFYQQVAFLGFTGRQGSPQLERTFLSYRNLRL